LEELPFKSHIGVIGSWVGFVFNSLVFVAQFWIGFSPEGYADMSAGELVEGFFEVYLAAPIIVLSYVGYKVWFGTRWVRLWEVDLRTGIREGMDELEGLKEREREEERGYYFFC
jgi:amino acid transporter